MPAITVQELRNILFLLPNQKLTITELRYKLFILQDQQELVDRKLFSTIK